jgi:hypothetical protein
MRTDVNIILALRSFFRLFVVWTSFVIGTFCHQKPQNTRIAWTGKVSQCGVMIHVAVCATYAFSIFLCKLLESHEGVLWSRRTLIWQWKLPSNNFHVWWRSLYNNPSTKMENFPPYTQNLSCSLSVIHTQKIVLFLSKDKLSVYN